MNIDFEPFKPINTSLTCVTISSHVVALSELLENDDRFGFIIMDGNGALFGAVCGNTEKCYISFPLTYQRSMVRGGQSALRFSRLKRRKKTQLCEKVAEVAVQNSLVLIRLLLRVCIFGWFQRISKRIIKSDLFDNRLQAKVTRLSMFPMVVRMVSTKPLNYLLKLG